MKPSSRKPYAPGTQVRLTRDAWLMSTWRGIATVLRDDGPGGSSEIRRRPNASTDDTEASDVGERAIVAGYQIVKVRPGQRIAVGHWVVIGDDGSIDSYYRTRVGAEARADALSWREPEQGWRVEKGSGVAVVEKLSASTKALSGSLSGRRSGPL